MVTFKIVYFFKLKSCAHCYEIVQVLLEEPTIRGMTHRVTLVMLIMFCIFVVRVPDVLTKV